MELELSSFLGAFCPPYCFGLEFDEHTNQDNGEKLQEDGHGDKIFHKDHGDMMFD